MTIYIAGIYRSGSTWLFNAVRLLVIQAGFKTDSGFIWWTLDEEAECKVIKTHSFYDNEILHHAPDFIVTSRRERSQIIGSMDALIERGLDPQFIMHPEKIDEYFAALSRWERHPKHVYQMDFEDLHKKNTIKILKDLNRALGLTLKLRHILAVNKQLAQLKSPAESYDPITLLTSTHYKH